MALAAHSSSVNSNWGRWSQPLQEYGMMSSQGFLPYDGRAPGQGSLPRPAVSQQPYVMPAPTTSTFAHHTLAAPVSATQYHNQSSYIYDSSYAAAPPSANPLVGPFRTSQPTREHDRTHDYYDRSSIQNPMVVAAGGGRQAAVREPQSSHTSRSESVSSSSRPSNACPTANAKNITFNETYNPEDQVDFRTDVDQLMKMVQVKKGSEGVDQQQHPLTPVHTPKHEQESTAPSPVSCGSTPAPAGSKSTKKWFCDGPNCNKSFVQKTHLDIHRRTHTGQRPYVCRIDGCGLTFSQRGNLRTHERRHTGEKPFPCTICGKRFAQRGNVRSHEQTHKGLKPFICKLDNCSKTFSQLGNMKTHQNSFHKSTLQNLTASFAKFAAQGAEVPESFRELFDYFREHYKNSNKGIKGRGKSRSVGPKKRSGEDQQGSETFSPLSAHSHQTQSSSFPSPSQPHDHSRIHHAVPPVHMLDHVPRTQPGPPASGYPMYEAQHHAMQHHHHPHPHPGGMVYASQPVRHMDFPSRMY